MTGKFLNVFARMVLGILILTRGRFGLLPARIGSGFMAAVGRLVAQRLGAGQQMSEHPYLGMIAIAAFSLALLFARWRK